MKNIKDTIELNNGVKMPVLGLGVWQVENDREAGQVIASALRAGYRSIDTAAAYGNEEGVGKAIRESGIPREEIFVTTKLWNPEQGYESTLRAFDASLKRLGMEYVDLYLIHWPVKGKYTETWRAFEKIYREGRARAIGVSNFYEHHLKGILSGFEIVPAVNQVELHPLMTLNSLRSFCAEHGIRVEAWSPLMQGNLDNPVLEELGKKYGKSPAQIVLRWDIQHGIITIPKSAKESRIRENADIFDFELTAEEMGKIDALDRNRRFGADPENFNF